MYYYFQDQFSSATQLCLTLFDPTDCSIPGFSFCPSPNSQCLLKLMSIELVMPFNHLILCQPLLLLPSIFPSIKVFSNESVLHIRWPKYWTFSYSISPSNEQLGLISFRIELFDFLLSKGLSRVFSSISLRASILPHSAFFMVQLAHAYMKVKVAQACPTLCHPMGYKPHGTPQARVLECVAFPFSRGSSQSRD